MHQLVGLRLGGLDDGAVAVAGVGDADAGEAVDVLGAVGVVEQGALAVVGDDRLDALHEPGHDVVAVLLLHTHGIDHPSANARIDNGQGVQRQRVSDGSWAGGAARARRGGPEQAALLARADSRWREPHTCATATTLRGTMVPAELYSTRPDRPSGRAHLRAEVSSG